MKEDAVGDSLMSKYLQREGLIPGEGESGDGD
jgi:hypothetical protein